MIRPAATVLAPPRPIRPAHPRTEVPAQSREPQPTYDRSFWLAYASNGLVTVAVALLYRYADFVTLLGGTEFHLGWIVGVGMVGSLFMRLALGSWIDRFGSRPVWLISTVLFATICFAHLAISSHMGMAIYLLRIGFCCAIAGVYVASTTFVTARAPAQRMAELVGMLGTAGFLGMVLGTGLGDLLFGAVAVQHPQVVQMFVIAGLCGILSLPFAWAASLAEKRQAPPPGPPTSALKLLLRQYSGMVLLVGVVTGMGLGLPSTFLRTYAAELEIPRISLFFTVYAAAAIVTRVGTRRWFERFGTQPLIVLGVAGLATSQLLFLVIHAEWQLFLPAIGYGSSHAIIFPAIVAAGSTTFPKRNRGLATVLVLAAWDLGILVGAPLAGVLLKYSERAGLPPYPTMFIAMAVLLGAVCTLIYSRIPRASSSAS